MITAFYDTKPYDREYFARAAAGAELQLQFHEFRLTTETAATAAGASAVCVFVNDKLDRPCLEKLSAGGVRMIALRCAGYNNVDLSAAKALRLAVTNVPAYSPYAVAEHTVALLLALNRKIHRAYNRVREHNFSLGGLVGFDLHGKIAGIAGTGKIGKITAQILCGFGMKVIAYDPFPAHEWARSFGINYVSLEGLLQQSNVVSLHLPLTPHTFHLLNEKTLALMKKDAFLINTSRGKLIDTTALIQALKKGEIGNVALDVYEEEEGVFFEDFSGKMLNDDELTRLLTFPNVLITSHQAFLTAEALSEIARVTTANLMSLNTQAGFLQGTALAPAP
ncbi:MAG: 2-hydroxyacid dehydrogenase [Verrucomicrobiales bacterium]